MHRLADSLESLIMKHRMFSTMIVKNDVLQKTYRTYVKKVPEKTFNFLQQFMMISMLRVYNCHWGSHLIEIGMNYTLKKKIGYDPVIHGNNDPLGWARTFEVTDWVEYFLKKHIYRSQELLSFKVFNQPGIDEPDEVGNRFLTNLKIFEDIEDVNDQVSDGVAYVEVFSEGDYVYKRYWCV
jgi:hypothetical protein